MSSSLSFRYTSGNAAANLYMKNKNGEYQITFDWSYDAIYFRNPVSGLWFTLGTGEQTTKCDWDNMNANEQLVCVTMLLHTKNTYSDTYARTKVNQMLQSRKLIIAIADVDIYYSNEFATLSIATSTPTPALAFFHSGAHITVNDLL
jgi:hypothetical protein